MADDSLRRVISQLSKRPKWAVRLARPNIQLVQFLMATHGTSSLHADTLVRQDLDEQRQAKYGSAPATKTKSVHNPKYQRKLRAYTRLLQELQTRGFVVYDSSTNAYRKTEDAVRLYRDIRELLGVGGSTPDVPEPAEA